MALVASFSLIILSFTGQHAADPCIVSAERKETTSELDVASPRGTAQKH